MNQSRFDILSVLEAEGPSTARTVAERVGSKRQNVAMVLCRARRDGLAFFDRRSGVHGLSQRGHDRLAWLRERST